MLRARMTSETNMVDEPEDSREAISRRLRAAREAIGLTQKEFAEMAGLLTQTYGPFETGKRDLTLEAARKIRRSHGLSLEFLFFGNKADLPHRIAEKL